MRAAYENKWHIRLFYAGCLARKGYIDREDRQMAQRIKEYLAAINELKRGGAATEKTS